MSAITVAAIALPGHLNVSRATDLDSIEDPLETEVTPQALPDEMPQTLSQSVLERFNTGIGSATYRLEDSAIEFIYNPESFILESFDATTSDVQNLSVALWSKEDYLTIKNAGDELGDFPTKLALEVLSNPEGISVVDWLAGSPDNTLRPKIQYAPQPDTTIAGRDAWTFSYKLLFEYEGIAFQSGDDQIVVITAYKPPADSTTPKADEDYAAALTMMVESIELKAPISE